MKKIGFLLIMLSMFAFVSLNSCKPKAEEEESTEEVSPAEEEMKEAADEVEDAAEEVGEAAEETVEDIKEDEGGGD